MIWGMTSAPARMSIGRLIALNQPREPQMARLTTYSEIANIEGNLKLQ